MRPIRFLLSLATCILAFFLLLSFGPWRSSTQEDLEERSGIQTYFNWRTPSSLFPPSAIISLTDDNSTFFLARPAAFGPLLPAKSLSGQLWVGSGFANDHMRGGVGSVEGELGCSDIPDWDDADYAGGNAEGRSSGVEQGGKGRRRRRSVPPEDDDDELELEVDREEYDGTDDHLHHPLSPSDGLKTNRASVGKRPTHADIQSLQEGAEIAGKVVLLSRGGCGFLEKVKWVQRRGGVALIVGDDIRGGPLVTMYARGDTTNVTIPSLFTSHTTAHLLSSLIPSGGILDHLTTEEAARLGLALGNKAEQTKSKAAKPNFTTTSIAVKATSTAKAKQHGEADMLARIHNDDRTESDGQYAEGGWFHSLFSSRSGADRHDDSRRPPNSGHIGWVLQAEFEDDEVVEDRIAGKQTSSSTSNGPARTKAPGRATEDGFVIGVQDWRDPDLVAELKDNQQAVTASLSSTSAGARSTKSLKHGLKGGSIMPLSGEYGKAIHAAVDLGRSSQHASKESQATSNKPKKDGSWLARLFSSHEEQTHSDQAPKEVTTKVQDAISRPTTGQNFHRHNQVQDELSHHEGLWITLTPTSMSSSPFFDTLLVLVVSPLVTLTVVYALLLLRSRIRRRRWRAPKSVVERLPVRTYQTMPSTTTTSSSTTSAGSTPAVSATTPLLHSNARPIDSPQQRSRPRARTASEIPAASSSLRSAESLASPSLEEVEEKRAAGLAEWRRRYGGKQRECVVCLEEYVDGVSRVMSLPCGHEFHEGCMYVPFPLP